MKYLIDESSLTGIADALRSVKNMQAARYSITGMIDEIGTLYSLPGTGIMYSDTLEISEDGDYYPETYECNAFSAISVSAGYNMAQSIYSDMRSMVGYVVTDNQGDYLWDMLSAQQAISTYSDFHNQIGYLNLTTTKIVDTTHYSQLAIPYVNLYLSTLEVSENGTYGVSGYYETPPIYGYSKVIVSVSAVPETHKDYFMGELVDFGVGTMTSLAYCGADIGRDNGVTFEAMSIPDSWFEGNAFVGDAYFSGVGIGAYAFQSTSIPAVTLVYDTAIGSYAFANATIGNAGFDSTVTLGEYAFSDCDTLSRVSIPFSRVPYGAFYGCMSLEAIDFTESFSVVGSYAFCECAALARVYASDLTMVPRHGDGVFNDCSSLSAIYVDERLYDDFMERWSEYASLFTC